MFIPAPATEILRDTFGDEFLLELMNADEFAILGSETITKDPVKSSKKFEYIHYPVDNKGISLLLSSGVSSVKLSGYQVNSVSPVHDAFMSLIHRSVLKLSDYQFTYYGSLARDFITSLRRVRMFPDFFGESRFSEEVSSVVRWLSKQSRGRVGLVELAPAKARIEELSRFLTPYSEDCAFVVDYFETEGGIKSLLLKPEIADAYANGGGIIICFPVVKEMLHKTAGTYGGLTWKREGDMILTGQGKVPIREYAEILTAEIIRVGGYNFAITLVEQIGDYCACRLLSNIFAHPRVPLAPEMLKIRYEGKETEISAAGFSQLYQTVASLSFSEFTRDTVVRLTSEQYAISGMKASDILAISSAVYFEIFIRIFENSVWVEEAMEEIRASYGSLDSFLGFLAYHAWYSIKSVLVLARLMTGFDTCKRFLQRFARHFSQSRFPVVVTYGDEDYFIDDVLVHDFEETREVKVLSGKSQELVDRMVFASGVGGLPRDFKMGQTTLYDRLAVEPTEEAVTSIDPVCLFNEAMSELMPDAALSFVPFHGEMLHNEKQNFNQPVMEMHINPNEARTYGPREAFLSKVCGSQTASRRQTIVELIRSLQDRNLDVPRLSEDLDLDYMFDEILEYCGNVMFVDNWRELGKHFRSHPIESDYTNIVETVMKLPPEKRDALLKGEIVSWEQISPQKLQVTVKSTGKPKAKYSDDYAGSQTVVFNYSEDNLAASPFFSEVQTRFEQLFKSNVRLGSHISPDGVAEWASRHMTSEPEYSFEADISKFDKSEGENAILGLEQRFYLWLGLLGRFSKIWFDGQEQGTMKAVAFAFKLVTDIQRRSGQRTTLLGNVVVALMFTVYFFKVTVAILIRLFAQGDDVTIVTRRPLKPPLGVEMQASAVSNILIKPEWFRYSYGCSRFFIPLDGKMYWIYDPMLFAVKLSRPISKQEEKVLEERWKSYKEMVKHYESPGIAEQLVLALIERYGLKETTARGLIRAGAKSVIDYKTYRSLWETKPTIIGY